MVRSYLLVRWIGLADTGVHMELSIHTRDAVPHRAFKDTRVDERHCRMSIVDGC